MNTSRRVSRLTKQGPHFRPAPTVTQTVSLRREYRLLVTCALARVRKLTVCVTTPTSEEKQMRHQKMLLLFLALIVSLTTGVQPARGQTAAGKGYQKMTHAERSAFVS